MSLTRSCQLVALVLTALLMATAFGHVLEMPVKMNVPGPAWLSFQQTLYPAFTILGEPIELCAVLAAIVLVYLTRRDNARRHDGGWFGLPFAAAALLAISFFGIWLGLVYPVNARMASWTAASMPPDWPRWRDQWEISQAARFILQFLAFYALASSILLKGRTTAP